MDSRFIGFIPPIDGVASEFNTFRLGSFYEKNLTVGDIVFLTDEKNKTVFGAASVTQIDSGKLAEMCVLHAYRNHTQLGQEGTNAPEQLYKVLQKIYGPHIATPEKKATVIYLKRCEFES